MYKAKRNMIFGGKGFEKGKEYDLTPDEIKNIGGDFEGVKMELAEEEPEQEAEAEPRPKKVKKEEPQGEKKAKRR